MLLGEISQGPFLNEEPLDINGCKRGCKITQIGYPVQVVSSKHTYKCALLDGITRLSLYSHSFICICVCAYTCAFALTTMKESEAMNVREHDGKGCKYSLYVKCKY